MLCVPTVSALVVQVAVRVLPVPESVRAEQPLIDEPPAVKFTLPVGMEPVTVAVNVTVAPSDEGLSELASDVLVATNPTTCETALLLEVPLLPSPP